jgi:hypothetical protein
MLSLSGNSGTFFDAADSWVCETLTGTQKHSQSFRRVRVVACEASAEERKKDGGGTKPPNANQIHRSLHGTKRLLLGGAFKYVLGLWNVTFIRGLNPKDELRALPALHNSTAIRVLTSCFTLMQSGRQLHPTLDRTPICARSAVRIGRGSFRSPEWMGTVQHVDAGDPELILLGYM